MDERAAEGKRAEDEGRMNADVGRDDRRYDMMERTGVEDARLRSGLVVKLVDVGKCVGVAGVWVVGWW